MRSMDFNASASTAVPGTFPLMLPANNFGVVLMLKNSGTGPATISVSVGASVNIKTLVAPASTLNAGESAAVEIPAAYAYMELGIAGAAGFIVSGELSGGGF